MPQASQGHLASNRAAHMELVSSSSCRIHLISCDTRAVPVVTMAASILCRGPQMRARSLSEMIIRVIAQARETPNRIECRDSTAHLRGYRHLPDDPQYADLIKECLGTAGISRLLWRPCRCLWMVVLWPEAWMPTCWPGRLPGAAGALRAGHEKC